MKRFIGYLPFILSLIIFSHNIFSDYQNNLYLENHYGAPIKYKTGTANSTAPETNLNNQARGLVGILAEIADLSIRTTGKGSTLFSYFTELTQTLQQVKTESLKQENKEKDAIILIKPSRSYQNWEIAIHWEKPDQSVTELPDELMAIMNDNVLGEDYGQKSKAIYDYDYTKSTKGGFVNLRDSLIKSVKEVNRQMYAKVAKRKGVWVAPDAETLEDLKNTINRLYNALQKYRLRDGV